MQWCLISISGANVALRGRRKPCYLCDSLGCCASVDILTFLNVIILSQYIRYEITSVNDLCQDVKLVVWPNHKETLVHVQKGWSVFVPLGHLPDLHLPQDVDEQRWILTLWKSCQGRDQEEPNLIELWVYTEEYQFSYLIYANFNSELCLSERCLFYLIWNVLNVH